jgi:peptide chain release factor 2
VGRETAGVLGKITRWKKQREGVDEAGVFVELAEEGDRDALDELGERVAQVEQETAELELTQLLGGEHDPGNAIVEIHPGAGGLEAQDWAEMLLRMYLRWCERRGFRT